MYETQGEQLSLELISSAEDSRARTYPPATPEELAWMVIEAACGGSSSASSTSCGPHGSSSRTSQATAADGSLPSASDWSGSGTKRYRSRLRRAFSALPTVADASSLLPTPTASRYGSSNNGCPHDHRTEYRLKRNPSMWQLVGGRPDPSFVERMMGFPAGWLTANSEP